MLIAVYPYFFSLLLIFSPWELLLPVWRNGFPKPQQSFESIHTGNVHVVRAHVCICCARMQPRLVNFKSKSEERGELADLMWISVCILISVSYSLAVVFSLASFCCGLLLLPGPLMVCFACWISVNLVFCMNCSQTNWAVPIWGWWRYNLTFFYKGLCILVLVKHGLD